MTSPARLVRVDLDPVSLASAAPEVDHEREVAIYDLLQVNSFAPEGLTGGPWILKLSVSDNRLILDVTDVAGTTGLTHPLSLTTLRRLIKDYFLTCDTYYAAVRTALPAHLEALDHDRRRQHDAGAEHILARTAGVLTMDFATARGLFTLISTLYWKR